MYSYCFTYHLCHRLAVLFVDGSSCFLRAYVHSAGQHKPSRHDPSRIVSFLFLFSFFVSCASLVANNVFIHVYYTRYDRYS